MKYIGIDYGRRKIGFAVSEGILAEPYQVLRVKNESEAIEKIVKTINILQVKEVVLGISEGEMAKEIKEFGEKLQKELTQKIMFHDETLSTLYANKLSLESGKKQKKRREMEDAYAATVMLQSFLDQSV